MRVTLTQATKRHDVNKLHDAFIAAGIPPALVESNDTASYFTFSDNVDAQAVQGVIDGYKYEEVRAVGRKGLLDKVRAAKNVNELRDAVVEVLATL